MAEKVTRYKKTEILQHGIQVVQSRNKEKSVETSVVAVLQFWALIDFI